MNAAFDSFKSDYLQAQGTYFANVAGATSAGSLTFFKNYIVNRVNLLSAQLTNTFSRLPKSLNKISGASPSGSLVLQSFLRQRIDGTGDNTLRTLLVKPIPQPAARPSGPIATLYTDQALGAIETARANTLNAADFLIRRTFHNG